MRYMTTEEETFKEHVAQYYCMITFVLYSIALFRFNLDLMRFND